MDLSLVEKITREQLRTDIPAFKVGDTVKVHVRIKEGAKTRIQMYEGVVVDRNNGGIGATFMELQAISSLLSITFSMSAICSFRFAFTVILLICRLSGA